MKIFCLNEFKEQFEKLKKHKSYSTIEADLIDFFYKKNINDILSGTRLNNSDDTPYIKKRLKGSGGFRLYFLAVIKDEKVVLLFLHPKTGSMGFDNITDESKALLYKKALQGLKDAGLTKVTVERHKISFDEKIYR